MVLLQELLINHKLEFFANSKWLTKQSYGVYKAKIMSHAEISAEMPTSNAHLNITLKQHKTVMWLGY